MEDTFPNTQGRTSILLLFGLHSTAINTNRHCIIRAVQCRVILFGLHSAAIVLIMRTGAVLFGLHLYSAVLYYILFGLHSARYSYRYCINTNRNRVILFRLYSAAIILELKQRHPLSIRTRPPSYEL